MRVMVVKGRGPQVISPVMRQSFRKSEVFQPITLMEGLSPDDKITSECPLYATRQVILCCSGFSSTSLSPLCSTTVSPAIWQLLTMSFLQYLDALSVPWSFCQVQHPRWRARVPLMNVSRTSEGLCWMPLETSTDFSWGSEGRQPDFPQISAKVRFTEDMSLAEKAGWQKSTDLRRSCSAQSRRSV